MDLVLAQTILDATPSDVGTALLAFGMLIVIGCVKWAWDAHKERQQAQPAAPSAAAWRSRSARHDLRAEPVPVAAPPEADNLATADLPRVNLRALANALNIAIIGPKESGKTTTMAALLALRPGYVESLDPHNEPGKWPNMPVIGGGERFDLIHGRLLVGYTVMRQRYAASDRGERTQATYQRADWRVTWCGDEWGGIVGELPDVRPTKERPAIMGAGTLLGKLLARGRKVGLGMLIAAHDDTAAQLGLGGEMGLIDCFNYLIYLGGAATGNTKIPLNIRQAARHMKRPAVVLDTERQAWALVILDNLPAQRLPHRNPVAAPADYRQAVEGTIRPAFNNAAPPVNVQIGDELDEPRSGRSYEVQDSVQRSAFSAEPPKRPESSAPILSEPLNPNAEITGPATADELRQLGTALRLFAETNRKGDSICKAFGVTKGGRKDYKRAVWLFDQAMGMVADDQADERADGQRVTRAA